MFDSVRKSVPQYHQSTTNVQQEFLQSFENMVGLFIIIQKEFVQKMGIASNTPVPMLNIIDNASEEFVKVSSTQKRKHVRRFKRVSFFFSRNCARMVHSAEPLGTLWNCHSLTR